MQSLKKKRTFFIIFTLAIIFKLSIFSFGPMRVPESMFDSDSESYLVPANTMYSQGVFGVQDKSGKLHYETFRTPGYPAFLAVFHNLLEIPLISVVFLQLILTILAGLVVYKLSVEIDSKLGLLSMAIFLFDPPIAVYSLKIMAEAVFLIPFCFFLYTFIKYLKYGNMRFLLVSSLMLIASVYVRPVTYYLGVVVAVFVLYVNISRNLKKAFVHAILFLVLTYAGIGIWQIRNQIHTGNSEFAKVINHNMRNHSITVEVNSEKDKNPFLKGFGYLRIASRSFLA